MHPTRQNSQSSQFSTAKHASTDFPKLPALSRPKTDQRRFRIHLTLRSAAARSTLCSTLSCSLTGKWRTIFFCPARSTDPRRRPVQRADRPRSHRRLLPRPRRPPTDRGPRTTGRHGSPTAMVDDHCHLPHGDQLPTPPGGVQLARESRSSVFLCSHAYNFNVNPNQSACNGEWQFSSLGLIYHAQSTLVT